MAELHHVVLICVSTLRASFEYFESALHSKTRSTQFCCNGDFDTRALEKQVLVPADGMFDCGPRFLATFLSWHPRPIPIAGPSSEGNDEVQFL